MTERISAHELQIRYEIKHKLIDFTDEMKAELYANIREKGDSWKTCGTQFLINKIKENTDAQNWVNVANFAFMLRDLEREFWEVK